MCRYAIFSFTVMFLSVASAQAPSKIDPATDEAAELTELFHNQAREMMKEYEFTLPERLRRAAEAGRRPVMPDVRQRNQRED